jgi:hypothetical protein
VRDRRRKVVEIDLINVAVKTDNRSIERVEEFKYREFQKDLNDKNTFP